MGPSFFKLQRQQQQQEQTTLEQQYHLEVGFVPIAQQQLAAEASRVHTLGWCIPPASLDTRHDN